jgi:hypothetical protein
MSQIDSSLAPTMFATPPQMRNNMITLRFDEEEFLDALKELNFLVVSPDRMGSFYAEKPDDEFKQALSPPSLWGIKFSAALGSFAKFCMWPTTRV